MRARERRRWRQSTTSSATSRVGGSARPRGPLCTTRPELNARVIRPIQSTSAPFADTDYVNWGGNKLAYPTRRRGWVGAPTTKVEPEPTPELEPEVLKFVVAPKTEAAPPVSDSTEKQPVFRERYNMQNTSTTKHTVYSYCLVINTFFEIVYYFKIYYTFKMIVFIYGDKRSYS